VKVKLENGERLVVEVPIGNVLAYVAIMAEPVPGNRVPTPLVDVTVENGLVGEIKEHVCRHPSDRTEDRIKLWAHIVSQHASMLSPETPLDVLIDAHEHEHDGPGTIRNHPRDSRTYSLKKLGKVLSEAEDHDAAPADSASLEHEYLASYSGGREVGCHICRKPRSAHPIG
jgi:hypothetical protein